MLFIKSSTRRKKNLEPEDLVLADRLEFRQVFWSISVRDSDLLTVPVKYGEWLTIPLQ